MIEHNIENLLLNLASLLTNTQRQLASAESCTGGWLAQLCTSLPGSSAWFERGFVTYSNQAKQEMLGVDPDLLARCGAVSKEVAIAMAQGALRYSHAHCSVAITGIAGPDGGSLQKPVGSVWLAWAGELPCTVAHYHCFSGDRQAVRRQAVTVALQGLVHCLLGEMLA